MKILIAGALVLSLSFAVFGAEYEQKWLYASTNLSRPDAAAGLLALMDQAKGVGCTHILLSDSSHLRIDEASKEYFDGIAAIKAKAKELGITLIPTVFPSGYGGRYLNFDRHLAAGLPARNVPFVVKAGQATSDPTDVPVIANPGFEEAEGDKLAGWTGQDLPGKHSFVDTEIKHGGDASLKITGLDSLPEEAERAVRVGQTIKVKPFRHYILSLWVKSEKLAAEREAYVHMSSGEGKRRNTYVNLRVREDQDWTQTAIDFNTLEAEEIEFSVGASDAESGTVWFDDIEVRPAGLVNVLRRDATPLTVTSADGATTYEEGKDYERIEDPDMGERNVGRGGPAVKIMEGSSIKDGDTILVSWFYSTVIYGSQVNLSVTDPKVFEYMDMEMRNSAKVWGATGYFMNVDEIRVGGWEPQPEGRKLTPGLQLAEYTRRAVATVRKHAPEADIYVWSDMYTPFHNARPFEARNAYYYLVNGNWNGAWEGLPSDVIIMNWYSPEKQAMEWFADRGHRQIMAGYYDGQDTPALKANIEGWMKASDGVPNVIGMMYTTWRRNYRLLEEYVQLLEAYPAWVEKEPAGDDAMSEK